MDFKQIEYFIEVCGQMSFTKAAKNLYISQQGISKNIKSMEEELGVPLFYRGTSSINLTEYGKYLYDNALVLNNDYLNLLAGIEEIKSNKRNELHIGIPHGMVNVIPANILAEFSQRHRQSVVKFNQYGDYDLEEALLSGEIDIGFCVAPVDDKELTVHHIRHENTYFMISEHHRLADCDSLDLDDLKDELFIGFGDRNKGHYSFYERCKKRGFTPVMNAESHDMGLIEEMCRCGLCVGFFVGDPKKRQHPGLRIIPDKRPGWTWDVCLSTRKGKCLNDLETEFINIFKSW